ncbi:hypothetical protein INT47_010510 [Mucor saturninus]|uniref:Uncharacterized protein n=1 Tax=Mucor saturninus TaxID=64648 RepID=A0A8H7V9B6_9FUNG|nr:hypothetical protein INT47_010510 [Mucor saturninus]
MSNNNCNCDNCNTSLETYVYSANEYFKEGNLRCSYFHFKNAINKYNDRDSYICVGIMYEKGWHVLQDYTKAIEYYTCAANQGAQDAQYRLGVIYYDGKPGVDIDVGKAFSWFQKASETTAFVPKLTWLDGAIPKYEMYSRDEAQLYLGKIYYFGHGVAYNNNLAIHWFQKSAEKENASAQYYLALMYYRKNGSQQSRNLAVEWLLKAAGNNHSQSQYVLGIYNYFGRDISKNNNRARYWFLRAVNTDGHPEALKCISAMDRNQPVELSNSLFFKHLKESIASTSDDDESDDDDDESDDENSSERSVSVSSDCETEEDGVSQQDSAQKSLQELKYKAEKGDPDAQNKLGEALRDNQGDKRETFNWFFESARRGHARGMYNVGKCFHEGIGVEMNPGKAIYAFKFSAERGDRDAQFMVGDIYRHGCGSLSIDYALAGSWYLRASNNGHVKAQYELGNLYFLEDYKDKSVSKALFWLSKAAKNGNSDAQYKLGVCFVEGLGVQKNYKRAHAKFLLAIENGNIDALLSIGMMYQKGLGVTIDYKQALKYYETAAEKDYDKAFLSIKNLKDIMLKEQSDSQKSVFKSGTEQFFHVGNLINALPDTDQAKATSSNIVRIIEERKESAVFLHVENHGVKVAEDRKYATNAIFNTDRGSTVYRKEEESAKFLHVEDTSIKIAEARKQSAVFMHVEDTSSNVSGKNGQPAHFFHVENTEIRVTKNNMYDRFVF